MFPTWPDTVIQAEFTPRKPERWMLPHPAEAQRLRDEGARRLWLVKLGSLLVRIGRSLQERYASPPGPELAARPMNDVGLQCP